MILLTVLIHVYVVYMLVNYVAAQGLHVPLSEVKAIVFMTSEKTLPVTIAVVSLEAFEGAPAQG